MAEKTMVEAKVTNQPIAEIGILIYPDCQLSAVHGRTGRGVAQIVMCSCTISSVSPPM